MGSGQGAKAASVTFESGRCASRRIAGVAAAARIVRELAEAGFAEAWLLLPEGERLSASAHEDIGRLAGSMKVEIGPCPSARLSNGLLKLEGNRLVPAWLLLDGEVDASNPAIVDLDADDASSEILRRTGKTGDGPVSRWLNRPVSRRISGLLLQIPGLHPNHASAGTALLAALMFAALILGGAVGLIAGAVLFQAASIFDGVDGEMARAGFRSSPAGAVIDTVVDVATNFLFISGLAFNLAWSGHDDAMSFYTWGFSMFVLGLAMIAWRSWRSEGPFSLDLVKGDYRNRFGGRLIPTFIRFSTVITSRDFYALASMVLILAGWPMFILYSFAPVTTVWILFVIATFWKGSPGAMAPAAPEIRLR